MIEHEDVEVQAAVLEAPDEVGTGVVVPPVPTAPHVSFEVQEERPTRGIGFDQHGLAFRFDERETEL